MAVRRDPWHQEVGKRRVYHEPEIIVYGKATDLALGDGQDNADDYSGNKVFK